MPSGPSHRDLPRDGGGGDSASGSDGTVSISRRSISITKIILLSKEAASARVERRPHLRGAAARADQPSPRLHRRRPTAPRHPNGTARPSSNGPVGRIRIIDISVKARILLLRQTVLLRSLDATPRTTVLVQLTGRSCRREDIVTALTVYRRLAPDDQPYVRTSREARSGVRLKEFVVGRSGHVADWRHATAPLRLARDDRPFLSGAEPANADDCVFRPVHAGAPGRQRRTRGGGRPRVRPARTPSRRLRRSRPKPADGSPGER